MKIVSRMGIKVLRTYNTSQYAHAKNLLAAIRELKSEDPKFEMYVMLGTWIESKDAWTYPSSSSKLNPWESTSSIIMTDAGVIEVTTGQGDWWGAAVEMRGGVGENLSQFADGQLHFDIRGDTTSNFKIGFQTGFFAEGTQVNNFVSFASGSEKELTNEWISYSIPISKLNKGADLSNVTAALFLRSDEQSDGKTIYVKNVYYSKI